MRKQRHRGEISVYLCLMIAVLLVLILAILRGIHSYEAKSRAYQAAASSIDSLKGDFQPDLFRRYHILAIDQTYYGRGEGYMEERLQDYLEVNLNSGETTLNEVTYLMDDSLADMKQQIQDYMKVKLPVDLVKGMLEKAEQQKENTESFDQLLRESEGTGKKSHFNREEIQLAQGGENDFFWQFRRNTGFMNYLHATGQEKRKSEVADSVSGDDEEAWDEKIIEQLGGAPIGDPRSFLDSYQQVGLLTFLMPDRAASVSRERIDLSAVPSAAYETKGLLWQLPAFSDRMELNEFEELKTVDRDIQAFNSGKYGMEELYGFAYALDSFQGMHNDYYAGDDEDHVFRYELEYIVEGGSSDYDNLTNIAGKLLLMRTLPNLTYACTDAKMKEEAELLATLLVTPANAEFIEPVTYVILVCWAFGESFVDVSQLFQGYRVPVLKNASNWQLSLQNLPKLFTLFRPLAAFGGRSVAAIESPTARRLPQKFQENGGADADGMNYTEYLIFLMALMPDPELKYYRMLDIMELNIRETEPSFKLEHCIDEFHVQMEITEQGNTWYIEGEGDYYLP